MLLLSVLNCPGAGAGVSSSQLCPMQGKQVGVGWVLNPAWAGGGVGGGWTSKSVLDAADHETDGSRQNTVFKVWLIAPCSAFHGVFLENSIP